ncbi:replication initiator protein A, partial [Helcococcus kunzii]
MGYDYFYGNETEQYSFIRIPKVFFTNDKLNKLSAEAKILYGVLLDRSS